MVSRLLEFRKQHALEDHQGANALISAVRREDKKAFEELMNAGAKTDGKDADGKTALDYASQLNNTHIVDLLNKRQLEQTAQTEPTKFNSIADIALLLAFDKGHDKIAALLLDVDKNGEFSANVNACGISGMTALMLTADKESAAMLEKLLETSIQTLLKDAEAQAAPGDAQDDIDSHADAMHGDLSVIDEGDCIAMPDTPPVAIIASNAPTDCGVVTTDAVFQA